MAARSMPRPMKTSLSMRSPYSSSQLLRAGGRVFGGGRGSDGLRDGGGGCGGDSFCGGEGIGMAEHEGEAAAGGGEAFDVFERTGDEDVVE